ncbi:MAG: hypothetical protein QXJ75_00970 [Candidatus Bathyarchaeia archaeon]
MFLVLVMIIGLLVGLGREGVGALVKEGIDSIWNALKRKKDSD